MKCLKKIIVEIQKNKAKQPQGRMEALLWVSRLLQQEMRLWCTRQDGPEHRMHARMHGDECTRQQQVDQLTIMRSDARRRKNLKMRLLQEIKRAEGLRYVGVLVVRCNDATNFRKLARPATHG
jgi:hypothetical protein